MDEKVKELHETLRAAILDLDADAAERLAREILDSGGDARETIDSVIKPTADEIGEKFEQEEFFLPQLMLAGAALEQAMTALLEAVPSGEGPSKRSVLIGTVKGDIHTIGKNVVAMMLRTGGFEVHDLGVDVNTETFIREALARNVDIIAMSSLLTTTLPYQRDMIEELRSRGLRDRFKVLVGGGPATQAWADEIGADGFGKDAAEGLAVVRRLVGSENSK